MLDVYLLRHGQTLFNQSETVQGWNDSPLTAKGLFEAECAGYGLKDVRFTKVYSGDANRQINTAKAFLKNNLYPTEIITDYHFREMCFGKYEDGPYYDMLLPLYIAKNAPYKSYSGLYEYYDDIEIANTLASNDETGKTEGIEKTYRRFKQGLDEIVKENKNGNILISTSSIAIASVIYNLFPYQKLNGLVANASISIISYDGEYHLKEYNNTKYREIGEKHLSI